MNIKRVEYHLNKVRRENNLNRLIEADVEHILAFGVLPFMGYSKAPNGGAVEPRTFVRQENQGADIPDFRVFVSKSFSFPVEVKRKGELASVKSKLEHLKEKARYAKPIGNVGFGVLTDAETWVIFSVEPTLHRGKEKRLVRVLLEFEAVTDETTKMLVEKTGKLTPLATQKFKYQERLFKAILPRFDPAKMQNFLCFLYNFHHDLDWGKFDVLMNLSLKERILEAEKKCSATWHNDDEKFVKAFYSSAQHATAMAEKIIQETPLKLPMPPKA